MKIQAEKKQIFKALLSTGKVALAGATVAAIAFAFVVFDGPGGEVAPAEADLWSLFSRETSKHTKFMEVLEKEGMQPPRQYDYNGNQVFFSYGTTRESPRQVMHRFQDAFVREGVNKHYHPGARIAVDPEEIDVETEAGVETLLQGIVGAEDLFTGGMVPIIDARNEMVMIGGQTKQNSKNFLEVLGETRGGQSSLEEVVGAMRVITATREERGLQTTITAVWSDEYLDLNKFGARRRTDRTTHPVEMLLPLCGGCEQVTRLSGTRDENDLHNFLYRSRRSVHEVTRDYDRQMGKYGWQVEPALNHLNRLQRQGYAPDRAAQIRSYVRDGLNLTLIVYPDFEQGYTYVKMMTTT